MSDIAPRVSVGELMAAPCECIGELIETDLQACSPPRLEARQPCTPTLLGVPYEVFKIIFKYLGLKEKKSLRLVNACLLSRIDEHERILFKWWRFHRLSSDKLVQLANELKTIKGLEVYTLLDRGEVYSSDQSIEILTSLHPELVSIKLGRSSCSDKSLQTILRLENLIALDLGMCKTSGENLNSQFSCSKSILSLSLQGCQNLTDNGLICILSQVGDQLTSLCLSETNITLANIGSLGTSYGLTELNLSACIMLTDAGLAAMLEKSGGTLKSLNLSKTSLTLEHIQSLNQTLLELEEVDLSFSENITNAGLRFLLTKSGNNLVTMNLVQTNLNLEAIASIPISFVGLQNLNLSYCKHLTDLGLVSVLRKTGDQLKTLNIERTNIRLDTHFSASFPELVSLNLEFCRNVTEAAFTSLLSRVGGRLKFLNLGYCKLSLASIGAIETTFPRLEELKLFYCIKMTDAGLISLLNKTGRNLKSLNLQNTSVTLSQFEHFNFKFPCLEVLNLTDCRNIDVMGFKNFLNKTRDSLMSLYIHGSSVEGSIDGTLIGNIIGVY